MIHNNLSSFKLFPDETNQVPKASVVQRILGLSIVFLTLSYPFISSSYLPAHTEVMNALIETQSQLFSE